MKPTLLNYEYVYQDDQSPCTNSFLYPPLLSILANIAKGKTKIRILDLGCGNGSLTHAIARQGYEVVGIDESTTGIAIARQSFPECNFIQSSIYNLPYDILENSFDVVLAVEVIEHLFYPKELIRAARRCIKPDGHLVITTPYHGYLKNLALAMTGKMDQHFTSLWDGGHIKFFSVSTMRALLEGEKFTDVSFRFSGRLPYLWKSMICSCSLVRS
jgi:2-polyprenyl-3-methyl-5-hydroxy-6-metoxy-1,4-benzoquinol methylase